MRYIDELKHLKMYRKAVRLPIDFKDKKKGSCVILITPDINGSINTMNHPMFINKYHNAYYIEKSIMYYMNKENANLDGEVLTDISDNIDIEKDSYTMSENAIFINESNSNGILLFGDANENGILNESPNHANILRKIYYTERLRRPKEVFAIYDKIKEGCANINRTKLSYARYKSFNLFVDFYYYNELFFKNNFYRLDRGINLYFDILTRFINDSRLEENGYVKKTVVLPIEEWVRVLQAEDIHHYKQGVNPISVIYRLLRTQPELLKKWGGYDFVFLGNNKFFKVDFNEVDDKTHLKFLRFIKILQRGGSITDEDLEADDLDEEEDVESPKNIVSNIVDKIENGSRIEIHNLTGSGSTTKDELVQRIEKLSQDSTSTEEVEDKINNNNDIKRMILDISKQDEDVVKVNRARRERMSKLKTNLSSIEIEGRTVEEILAKSVDVEVPETALPVDSVNEEWSHLKFPNFEEVYDLEEDVVKMVNFLSSDNKKFPVSIRDVEKEDTSTSEDYVSTYTFKMEDFDGKRFSIKLDLPEFIDNKFLKLKGNKKAISRQLLLKPVVKTKHDTVQIVTNYNKSTLERVGNKFYPVSDRIIKTINKINAENNIIKVDIGDATRANNKYSVPVDYMELASKFNAIYCKDIEIILNQRKIRDKYGDLIVESSDSYPIGYDTTKKEIIYATHSENFSIKLKEILSEKYDTFEEVYDSTTVGKKYCYTRVKILNSWVPIIVVLAYNIGLTASLDRSGVEYEIHEKRPRYDKDTHDLIRFKNGYILYKLNYTSSLIMNGLKACDTENYDLAEMNNKSMYLDFLDLFGSRTMADGLDNFYELLIDPITREVLERYNMPTEYIDLMIYANTLLGDSYSSKHIDMNTMRYRSNEIVASYAYKAITDSYQEYKKNLKAGRKDVKMTIKQEAVLDLILTSNIIEEASELTPILEAEMLHMVSTKGPNGLNKDRAYGLDKRGFDESMLNLIAMSTPQGPGVGINRYSTIDMDVTGKRGYIDVKKDKEYSITKTFGFSEAVSPYGSTRDDPTRTSMNISQAKHTMRVKSGDPLIVTTGADEAMPYLLSNTFSFKSKDAGTVVEKTDDYMVLKYKNGTNEMVHLKPSCKKNSSSGFYIRLKLDTELNVGDKFGKNDIVAYDKESYSQSAGMGKNIANNGGTLVKFAMMNTDEGYEDSAIISDRIASRMSSDVVIKKSITLDKNTNILDMVEKGQPIQEGDRLVIFQKAFEEDDINSILKNLAADSSIISDLSGTKVASKYTGEIEDIKMYRTVEKEELSESLKKKFDSYEKSIKDIKKVMKKYDMETDLKRYEDPDYKLEPTGNLKKVKEGVLIDFYIKYKDKMATGDKLTFFIALKGIVKEVFPIGDEPYTDFRPDEEVGALLALGSVNGRMTCSIKINMMLNKIIIELANSVREILGLEAISVV